MKVLSGLVGDIGGIINSLSISSTEKKELETKMTQVVYSYAGELTQQQAEIVMKETQGKWLQRSWRPLVMLAFAGVVLLGTVVDIPYLENDSKFWNLIEIGLGGFVVGRSIEGAGRLLPGKKKKG